MAELIDDEQRTEFRFVVLRQGDGRATELQAAPDAILRPGDVLRVSRVRVAPDTAAAADVSRGPSAHPSAAMRSVLGSVAGESIAAGRP